jgi:cytidyltransferase-like protein
MNSRINSVAVTGGFDDIRSGHIRFLQEASRLGRLNVFLWGDALLQSISGKAPKFPQEERSYYLRAIRFVHRVLLVEGGANLNELPSVKGVRPTIWVVHEQEHTPEKQAYCQASGLDYKVVTEQELQDFPEYAPDRSNDEKTPRKKVVVTGCFDWFHSGHVRFFEEVCELGDVYVVIGHDANVRELKGPGHPLFSEQERRYMIQSIRHVKQVLISTGHGWLDAEPEILRIKPDIYAVNKDGDKPIKREFCQMHGIKYVVLQRLPKAGLQRRDSTMLRGF